MYEVDRDQEAQERFLVWISHLQCCIEVSIFIFVSYISYFIITLILCFKKTPILFFSNIFLNIIYIIYIFIYLIFIEYIST